MRGIKFRAWDGLKMHIVGGIVFDKGEIVEIDDDSGEEFTRDMQKQGWELMQYTGLKDRDGTDVYEGDLINFAGLKPLKIVWRDAGFRAPLLPYENSDPIALTQDGFAAFAEVIGNIYENPELLANHQ